MFLILGQASGVAARKIIALSVDNCTLRLLELIGVADCDCGTDATKSGRDATEKGGDVFKNKELKDGMENKEGELPKSKISLLFFLEL